MTKTELINKYRDINIDHDDWFECIYDGFKEDMRDKGIEVERMFFSGFWSQGDGACFEGGFYDTKLFINEHFRSDQYPMIRKLIDEGGSVVLSCSHRGHYYHENCTSFSLDADYLSDVLPNFTDFHGVVLDTMDMVLTTELEDFETISTEIFKDYMRSLYRRLEKEYDYLTSDDAVWEAIVANELDDITEPEEV